MFFGSLDSLNWMPVRAWHPDAGISRDMVAVLTVAGSLTRFLERHYAIQLAVRLHDQCVDRADASEGELLVCATGVPVLRRHVSLLHRKSVMFDAESVLPLDGVHGDLMHDLQAGDKPLGNLLLDRGLSLSRSDLSVAQCVDNGIYAGRRARRSVLRSESGTRALVVEVFHDEIWNRIAGAGRRYR